jgi:hypothetical protein
MAGGGKTRWLRLATFASLAALGSGCTALKDDVDASEFACPRGLARPFSVQTLIRVANDHGVSLKRDPTCGGGDSIDAASNIVVSDDVDDDQQVLRREGLVLCDIGDLPFAEPPFRVTRTKWPDDQETSFDVANISCAIYPRSVGQIDRFKAALEALRTAPVEQRSCPSASSHPVTWDRLLKTARQHGLKLFPDARCIEPGVVKQASTIVPYDRPADYDRVWYDQGEVTCVLRESAAPGSEEIATTKLSAGQRLDLLNLSCTIHPFPAAEGEQVARLRATLRDLA